MSVPELHPQTAGNLENKSEQSETEIKTTKIHVTWLTGDGDRGSKIQQWHTRVKLNHKAFQLKMIKSDGRSDGDEGEIKRNRMKPRKGNLQGKKKKKNQPNGKICYTLE